MNIALREDADAIVKETIAAVLPDEAVVRALKSFTPGSGRLILIAVGKAAWQMANTAIGKLGKVDKGIVITKYGYAKGDIPGVTCYEAGHPVPDDNSFRATNAAIDMVKDLSCEDTVLFLLSGGGSALFEAPLIPGYELQSLTEQMLASGADIVSMNIIRKRLSKVKGGRFAQLCAPAGVFSIVLSDIIGDPLDMIASGPAYPDSSTCEEALEISDRFGLKLSDEAKALLHKETPKELSNIETLITGSVKELCAAAQKSCERLGYKAMILTDELSCEAREAGSFMGSIIKSHADRKEKLAFIAGGETVVHLKGNGKGGRNQELALSAALEIAGIPDVALFSVGSDGTDGPTDAAGGYVDKDTAKAIKDAGFDPRKLLENNDAYNALKLADGLIITGATGTNVNDVTVALLA